MAGVPASIVRRLRGAAAVFAEHGLASARIDDVARVTGIPRATLYYHFRSKENVLAFVLRARLDELRTAVASAVAERGSVSDRLRMVVEAVLQTMAADPAAARLLVGNLGGAGSLVDVVDQLQSSFHEPVSRLIAEGVADGSLADVDPAAAASTLFGAVAFSGLYGLLVDGELDPSSVSDHVCTLMLDGLCTPSTRRIPVP